MKTIEELETYLKDNYNTIGALASDISALMTTGEEGYLSRLDTLRYLKLSCIGFDDFTIHPSILRLSTEKIDEMLDGPTMVNSILIEIKKAKTTYKIE